MPEIDAVLADEVPVSLASPATTGAMVKAGRLKALAITSPRRTILFPGVPNAVESGYPYAVSSVWFGLFAPGGTDANLVERISREATSIAKQPEFTKKYITAFSLDLVGNTPSEFAAAIRADVEATAEMVKAAGVQPE